jgi:hypothetical protein
MAGKAKKILTAAGVAAATTGLVVAAKRRKESRGGVFHVLPSDGGWAVEVEGGDGAMSRHPNKKEAVSTGRELARGRAPSRLVIHGVDGEVQRAHEYEG